MYKNNQAHNCMFIMHLLSMVYLIALCALVLLCGDILCLLVSFRGLCVTHCQDRHGSLRPDAVLSTKHIENSDWLPHNGPQGV